MSHVSEALVACAISAAVLVTPFDASLAQAPGGAVQFRPHRAVYDITFDHATPGSGVADMSGRMVYEMTGTSCGEYAQNMRFVTRMTKTFGDLDGRLGYHEIDRTIRVRIEEAR
jgi:hypothetical protein